MYEYAATPSFHTDGLAIVRKGYIVGEVYLGDYSMTIPHEGFSVAKSFTSALVGIAISKGLIRGINEKIYGFFPQWQVPGTSEAKKRITIGYLLTLTSGLEWNEDPSDNENDHKKMIQSYDYLEYVLGRPVTVEPGTQWNYSSGDCMLLSGIIREVSGMSAYEFAGENLFKPLGIHNVWYGATILPVKPVAAVNWGPRCESLPNSAICI